MYLKNLFAETIEVALIDFDANVIFPTRVIFRRYHKQHPGRMIIFGIICVFIAIVLLVRLIYGYL